MKVKMFLDSYIECPRCHNTMAVYKTRYVTPERWQAVCSSCGKVRKWRTGEE